MSTLKTQETYPDMPAIFIAHGSPYLALNKSKGSELTNWARALPQPKAILVISAHWETEKLTLGELNSHDNLIYDFSGFPDELYQLQYPAPGSSWLAQQVQAVLKSDFSTSQSNRGLDHGVWIPLRHMWPQAEVAILQMSLPLSYSNQDLLALGAKLSPLKKQGVLIICSGMITHNLSHRRAAKQHEVSDSAKAFDDWVKNILQQGAIDKLKDWQSLAPFAQINHPSSEHFRVLLIAAGTNNLTHVSFPIEGFEAGVFSRRSVQFN